MSNYSVKIAISCHLNKKYIIEEIHPHCSQYHTITDHVIDTDHVINWKEAKIEGRESDKYKRWVKEAITIRKQRTTMNRDEGQFNLSHVYDDLLVAKAYGNTEPKLTPSKDIQQMDSCQNPTQRENYTNPVISHRGIKTRDLLTKELGVCFQYNYR